MTQFPPQPEPFTPPIQPSPIEMAQVPRTSGMAISSLVCGIVGLVSCCLFVPSILGITFGGVALPAINRGQAAGKSLAISGIILGILGLPIGICFWVLLFLSPESFPIEGYAVSEADQATLEALGVLKDGEDIELFYASGFFSIKEGGVLLTDRRLVIYDRGSSPETCNLVDIAVMEFVPAASWLDEGQFTIELEDGEELYFRTFGMQGGDKIFERRLRRKISEMRKAAGRPAPKSSLTPIVGEEDKSD